LIRLKLKKNDETIIYLTEITIKAIKFTTSEINEMSLYELTNDMKLLIQIENSDLLDLYAQEADIDNGETLPTEVDSVRLLFNYALASFDSKFEYLDCELEVRDAFTNIASIFNTKAMFVMHFEEKYGINDKITHVNILLRERVESGWLCRQV